MEKCNAKGMKFNPATRRCYKSCDQRNMDTHPMTKKCRAKCKKDKIRRTEDFRCVSKNHKVRTKKNKIKKVSPNTKVTRIGRINKVVAPKPTPSPQHTPKEEQLIPPPLKKEIIKNFGLLDKFLQKGKGVDYIDFSPVTSVSDFIAIYLFKKYKRDCMMFPIKDPTEDNELRKKELRIFAAKGNTQEQIKNYEKHLNDMEERMFGPDSNWNQTKFLTNLTRCLETGEQLVIVPLRLSSPHFNMLFIKVTTREIIRFEPHGEGYHGINVYTELNTNNFLKKLTDDINVHFNLAGDEKFTYKPPSDLCPRYGHKMQRYDGWRRGFQSMEGLQKKHKFKEGTGFCQLWSWFFAECVMANPEMDIKDVYKEAWDAVNTDEGNFATIIRGYFLGINEELLKMNEAFSIHSNHIKPIAKTRAIFLRYLNESRDNLNTKPRKVFHGGINKKFKKPQKPRFILPSPNPRVTPIHL